MMMLYTRTTGRHTHKHEIRTRVGAHILRCVIQPTSAQKQARGRCRAVSLAAVAGNYFPNNYGTPTFAVHGCEYSHFIKTRCTAATATNDNDNGVGRVLYIFGDDDHRHRRMSRA